MSTTTTTSTSLPSDGDVLEAWHSFWEAWAQVRASDDLDPGPLAAVADPEVVEGAIGLFERQRASGGGAVETEVVAHGSVTAVGAEVAMVEDCVLLSPPFTDTAAVWYQADLRRSDSSWLVSELRIPSGGGCVPREMAEAAIAAYEAFYDGWEVFWDPPDPTHPVIDEVLAEPQRSLIVELLTEHQARGVALRGRPVTHPEVIEVVSRAQLVILSCLEPSPDYGVYDLSSGDRLADVPPVHDGQRNLESAVMVLEDGLWKVSDLQGQVDFSCIFAPTERGLPVI